MSSILRYVPLSSLAGAALACGESGPDASALEGIRQLRTVNGRSLPAGSLAIQGPVPDEVLGSCGRVDKREAACLSDRTVKCWT
jgi:hypothetical protein